LTRDHRRLAAIVSADVVGYSLLMGRDDSATLAGLKAHRRELIDPKIAEYSGRIVKTTGDGLLLEFASVVDAVRCAVDIQRGMAERNAGVAPEQRIDFRIGINVGDIIIDGDDIFGDGVNVAARLQTLAEPGGICVSRVVRDQVLDKLSFGFDDLGPQAVKNIVLPVEVYRVDLGERSDANTKRGRGRWPHLGRALGWRWFAAAAVAFVLVGAAVLYIFVRQTTAAPSGPPFMSVAVMPFTTASASADDEALAARITQDVTSALGRAMPYVLIPSHGLAAKYKGTPTDPRAVGRDLNVRYLVEGDVRNADGDVVVVARLVETTNGTQQWSDRVAARLSSSGRGADDIVVQLKNRLRPTLWDAERRRAAHLPKAAATAIDLTLRGDALWQSDPSPEGLLEARKLYEAALRLDSGSAEALMSVGWTLDSQLDNDPAVDHDRVVKELDEISSRAIRADRDNPNAWILRERALWRQWRWNEAFEANAEALRIDPYRNATLGDRGLLLNFTGRPEEALPLLEQAIALDPRGPGVAGYLQYQCRAYLVLGRYDDAILSCQKSLTLEDHWIRYLYLVAAYAQKGDLAKAAVAKTELLKRQPGMSIARIKAIKVSDNPIYQQQVETHLFAGLRKAGFPEN
jgi:adenylate cyclase